jgi:hypothetical protein
MMAGPALRAGAWPAVAGVSAAAMVAGGCGVLFPAATTVLLVAGALRGLALPWGSTALALAGNVLLGFAVAAVGRTRTD